MRLRHEAEKKVAKRPLSIEPTQVPFKEQREYSFEKVEAH